MNHCFPRINDIWIGDLSILPFIPFDVLLRYRKYNNNNRYSNDKIECLTICNLIEYDSEILINKLVHLFTKLKTKNMKYLSNPSSMYVRKIKTLCLISHKQQTLSVFNKSRYSELVKIIAVAFGGLYLNLTCYDVNIVIQTVEEFYQIFHTNLRILRLTTRSNLIINKYVIEQILEQMSITSTSEKERLQLACPKIYIVLVSMLIVTAHMVF